MPMASATFCTAFSEASRLISIAAELHVRGQVAEHHVGVADRRLLAALHVAGRARHGAGGLRTDAQRLGQFGHEGDGAAAGAHGAHVDRRCAHAHIADDGFAAHPGPRPGSGPRPSTCRPCRRSGCRGSRPASQKYTAPATPPAGPLISRLTGDSPEARADARPPSERRMDSCVSSAHALLQRGLQVGRRSATLPGARRS
jgi:hypothetical protein